jgi:hypothetical protein
MIGKMRFIFSIVILLGYNLTCWSSDHGLIIRVNDIKYISKDTSNIQNKIIYNIGFQILNNSNSEVRYWTMTCSWIDLWIVDNPVLSFIWENCDHNVPDLTQILPGQIKFFSANVLYTGSIEDTAKIDFKIGFILVKKKELNDFLDIFEFSGILSKKREKQKDIIWSVPFKLKVTPELKIIKLNRLINN